MGVRGTFNKVQDGGSWYPVTLDGYSSRGSYLSLQYIMFRYIEYKCRGRMMLHFKGSECRTSPSSTWYDRMEKFLMELGFTKSKVGSNIYFKVECGRLGYVNELTEEDELIVDTKRKC